MATVVRQKPRSPFGHLLREALDDTGVSVKELSRRIAKTPGQAEAKRRLLQKYVTGEVSPGPDARDEISVALGIDGARFAEDREREEKFQQIMNSLIPLADTMLELAIHAREQANS